MTAASPPAPAPARSDGRARCARQASWRWLLAGAAGCALSAGVAAIPGLTRWPAMSVMIAAVAGGAAIVALRPRRAMQDLAHDDHEALAELTRRVQMISEGDRSAPLSELLMLDGRLADLSRAVHDLATEAIATRRHTRLMHRRLGDNVKRETERATAQLRRQVLTDPLTGLGNRRALEHRVEALAGEHGRGLGVAVMLVDLDLFKSVNDTLGHPVGDGCLKFLAGILKSCVRRDDCVVRLGGDEFMLLMPGQTTPQAKHAAERIVSLFQQMPWPHRAVPRPGLSMGIAVGTVGDLAEDDSRLLQRADEALYVSKRSGRGTITCAEARAAA